MKSQQKFNVWIKGSFYSLEVYATSKTDAKKQCKIYYGRLPYHIEIA